MVEDLIPLEELKKSSNIFPKTLRFKCKELSIYAKRGWESFEGFKAFEIHPDGEMHSIILTDTLLDTGSETGLCQMALEFKDPFNDKFFDGELEFRERTIGSIQETKVVAQVTEKNYKFMLFNTRFISPIGFIDFLNQRVKTTINIGIHCITQFLNLMFFKTPNYYYFCSNFKDL